MHDHESTHPLTLVIPRRTVLKGSAALVAGASSLGISVRAFAAQTAAGATPAASPGASPMATPVPVADYVPSALRTDEYAILKAAVDRIVPSDDLGPGAAEMGAQVYIDRALGSTKAASLNAYREGLKALDVAAGSDGFAALSPDKQDELLTTAENGKLPGDPGGFFATLVQDTREGIFSDPVHGGNVDFAGWDLMGYPGIKLNWTEQDQQINAKPTPEHISVAKYQEAQS